MLNVRRAQLRQLANTRFAHRMADFLRAQFPDAQAVELTELRTAAERQIEQAQRYGLAEERHVASYVISAWLLGENFDHEMPAAAATLNDATLHAAAKAKWLDDWTLRLFETLEGKPA